MSTRAPVEGRIESGMIVLSIPGIGRVRVNLAGATILPDETEDGGWAGDAKATESATPTTMLADGSSSILLRNQDFGLPKQSTTPCK